MSMMSGRLHYHYNQGGGSKPGIAPPPPPTPKRGFNWFACCGIGCALLIVIGAAVFYFLYTAGKSMKADYDHATAVFQEVQAAELDQMKAEATLADAAALVATPDLFSAVWVETDGVVQQPFEGGFEQSGQYQGTKYYVGNMVFIVDVSNAPAVAQDGQAIRAWGKPAYINMGTIPILGPLLKLASSQDPNMPDITTMVFFFAKQVEAVEAETPEVDGEGTETAAPPADGRPPQDNSGQDQGWIR